MVLPDFNPGVRIHAPLRKFAQRRASFGRRQHGARGEVGTNTNHILSGNASLSQNSRDSLAEHLDVILRVLQGKVRRQGFITARQMLINDTVAIGMHSGRHLFAGCHIHQHSTPRFRAKVHADGIFAVTHRSPLLVPHRLTLMMIDFPTQIFAERLVDRRGTLR